MRAEVHTVLVAAVVGWFVFAGTAAAAGPDCVDLLTDCNLSSASLGTICGQGLHVLTGTQAGNISYVVFGAGVQSVSLIHCGSGATTIIRSDSNLCDLDTAGQCPPDQCNDNICSIEFTFSPAAAPTLNGIGLGLLAVLLFAVGVYQHRRSVW